METKNFFSHPTAIIDEGCEIGEGTKIWHFSHIMPNCILGEKCNIGQNVVISPGSRNAPLTIGFSEDNFFSCFSVVDERCAAFLHWVWHSNSKNPW